MLCKLGIKGVSLIDMDTIENHNIPNQLYGIDDSGMFKTLGARTYCDMLGSDVTAIRTVTKQITPENMGSELYMGEDTATFCLVDSMKARKELFEEAVNLQLCRVWIETRMGLTGYRIYLVHLDNEEEVKKYRETLYSDEDAEVSACGASQSIVTTAMQCASHAVGLWLAEKNGAEYVPNEIIFDVHSSFIMSRKFDKTKE